MNSDKKNICLRIRLLRKSKTLTQQAFADSLGITKGFLSDLERMKKEQYPLKQGQVEYKEQEPTKILKIAQNQKKYGAKNDAESGKDKDKP